MPFFFKAEIPKFDGKKYKKLCTARMLVLKCFEIKFK